MNWKNVQELSENGLNIENIKRDLLNAFKKEIGDEEFDNVRFVEDINDLSVSRKYVATCAEDEFELENLLVEINFDQCELKLRLMKYVVEFNRSKDSELCIDLLVEKRSDLDVFFRVWYSANNIYEEMEIYDYDLLFSRYQI